MDKMKVSQKIAELRARNGLTAKELGDKIEKSETTILNYEAGKIDISSWWTRSHEWIACHCKCIR